MVIAGGSPRTPHFNVVAEYIPCGWGLPFLDLGFQPLPIYSFPNFEVGGAGGNWQKLANVLEYLVWFLLAI